MKPFIPHDDNAELVKKTCKRYGERLILDQEPESSIAISKHILQSHSRHQYIPHLNRLSQPTVQLRKRSCGQTSYRNNFHPTRHLAEQQQNLTVIPPPMTACGSCYARFETPTSSKGIDTIILTRFLKPIPKSAALYLAGGSEAIFFKVFTDQYPAEHALPKTCILARRPRP